MVCYAVPVDVNHGVLCWGSDCESWWRKVSQWFWIMVAYAEALVCESWYAMLYQWSWIMHSYSQPVVVNHGELHSASGWKSCCDMLSQTSGWESRRVMLRQCFMNHAVQCLANICKSWQIMLCPWLCIMLCWASRFESWCERYTRGCELWWAMLRQWLWITVCYAEPGVWESWCVMLCQWVWITVR